jgi:diadenosine tetraphosphate (Ap4A) HIT family hydrolase
MNGCIICERQSGDSADIIFQNDRWSVRHSMETNILGYVLLESRRHFLDMSEADNRECDEFGHLISEVMKAVRAEIEPERVYTVSLAEAVPHFHVHIIPRTAALPRAYRGRGILSYPLTPASDAGLRAEICARLRRRLKTVAAKLAAQR